MAEVDIDGVKIWYDVHGEGTEHLLQIGGAGFAHENFGFVTHLMTPHFKVIETDLRGYGYAEEYDVERKFREARLYKTAPINNNLVLAYVGEHILGMPRSY